MKGKRTWGEIKNKNNLKSTYDSEEMTVSSDKRSMCSGSPGGFVRGSCSPCARIPADETGVGARRCPRTQRPPALSAAGPHDGSQSGQAQLLGALPRGWRCQMLRERDPCQLGTLGPCGCCWRGVVIVTCWGEQDQKLS